MADDAKRTGDRIVASWKKIAGAEDTVLRAIGEVAAELLRSRDAVTREEMLAVFERQVASDTSGHPNIMTMRAEAAIRYLRSLRGPGGA